MKPGNSGGGKELWFKTTQEAERDRTLGDLISPEDKVQRLQTALHAKAKTEPGFRFYQLYDKVYRQDILTTAYHRCKANGGVAGVDGQSFEDIKTYGEELWIGELAERLRKKDYRPEAVKRVWIPKPNGKKRPLGIPTITDRVVQTALMLVIEPIFEADLQPEQYAYRRDRGAHDAIKATHSLVNTGHLSIIEGDLTDYFGSIPHAELMKCLARRIVDRHTLHLVKMWLNAPVDDGEDKGNRKRSNPNRKAKRGTPQGAPISPLLSNLYMRRFILGWKKLCAARKWRAFIVNYADDFVICCKGQPQEAMAAMRRMMERLKLTVNEDKTRLCQLPQERFDFLGYTIGRCYSGRTGKAYLDARPSKKSIGRMVENIRQVTEHRTTVLKAEQIVQRLNRKLDGWANYFQIGPVRSAYYTIDRCASQRLRRWLCMKHQVAGDGWSSYPETHIRDKLGLTKLAVRSTR
jgi:group II intron reverse transcriptase/maturase